MLKSQIYFGNVRESGHIIDNTGLCILGDRSGRMRLFFNLCHHTLLFYGTKYKYHFLKEDTHYVPLWY